MKHFRLISLTLLLCLLLGLTACGSDEPVVKQIFAMDTYMELRAYGSKAEFALSEAVNSINQAAAELDPELETSTVYAMNHAQGQPVEVSDRILHMLDTVSTVYSQSGGALDLTVYPVVKAWGFIDSQYRVPDAQELEQLKAVPCFPEVQVDGSTVTLPAGAQLSFGSVAKGEMAEEVMAGLRSQGIKHAFVSLGGNVQTLGTKPDGSPWRIGVEDPRNPGGHLGVLEIGEKAVVTSGSYQRFFEQDGQLYHHIIDPATAAPAQTGLRSVTIVCDDGTMADSLSTTMFVLGLEGAMDYYHTYGGFELIFVTTDNRVLVSSGLDFTPTADGYTYEVFD